MKKLLTAVAAILIAAFLVTEGVTRKPVRKANPCIKKCQADKRECVKEIKKKKLKRAERKKEMRACNNQYKECVGECKKPKEEPAAETEEIEGEEE